MSEVYGAAYITIIALEGTSCESGLPGVSKHLQRIEIRRKLETGTLVGVKSSTQSKAPMEIYGK
jgi:hypothetical protein